MWARSEDSARRARKALSHRHGRKLTVTTDREALAAATLVVEAVAEEPGSEAELLRLACAACSPTRRCSRPPRPRSTSSELAHASGDPRAFFGLHVFNPVATMKLVELCFPDEAGDAVRARATAFCEAIGKTAVEVPDEPGFVVNRLLFPYLFDAVRLLERTGHGAGAGRRLHEARRIAPDGPAASCWTWSGIDVAEAIGEALHADTGDPAHRPPGRIKELVAERAPGPEVRRRLLRVRLG